MVLIEQYVDENNNIIRIYQYQIKNKSGNIILQKQKHNVKGYINRGAPVKNLTQEQLIDIFEEIFKQRCQYSAPSKNKIINNISKKYKMSYGTLKTRLKEFNIELFNSL